MKTVIVTAEAADGCAGALPASHSAKGFDGSKGGGSGRRGAGVGGT